MSAAQELKRRPSLRTLTSTDKASMAAMLGTIIILHAVGFIVLFVCVAPHNYRLGGDHPIFTVGVGVLAYTFGLRHAFDADHIAAIDNTIRKLLADGTAPRFAPTPTRRPLSVGFWFSLGHSTIVFTLTALLGAGIRALARPVSDDGSTLHTVTEVIGPSVSGVFLFVIGAVNLFALVGIWRSFHELRRGEFDEAALERRLQSRGLMNRFLQGFTRSISKPWHIYPIGVLFGLGFDTATEVGLLVLAGGAAAFDLPFYAILVLPVLFAAGMCLMDTVDGVFMNYAYGWAYSQPARKIYYNLATTSISVAVALGIGTIELAGVLTNGLAVESGPLALIANLDLSAAGYGIVAVFVVGWLVAASIWRVSKTDGRKF